MEKILLNDLFNFLPEEKENIRIKLNIYNGWETPLDVYKRNPEEVNTNWCLWKPDSGKSYYRENQIALNFIQIDSDAWLLTTVKKITKSLKVCNDIGYEAEAIKQYEMFFGRIVVKYHKSSLGTVFKFSTLEDDLEVLQILPSIYEADEFPGYENVCLSFQQLETILSRKKSSWLGALRNQKAVYLITDTNTGKMYVGSATGSSEMLLQRWKNYISDGTGGNKEFEILKSKEGIDYIRKYFQYAILENYNAKTDDGYILERESWWKTVLKTREFGYNGQ